mmetsp:Transcript_21371/g.24834  ORF Transcript_21371/g.24834 Transcript_21371/m.24834 type:complete len:349 (+) Transcript_21371:1-1047(+)
MNSSLPSTFRKLSVKSLSTKFRQCTEIVSCPFPASIRPTEVVVKNVFAGVNASDINFTAGTYKKGVAPPFDCGFEAMGTVVKIGAAVKHVKEGDAVVTQCFGGFSEFQTVPLRNVKRCPEVHARYLPLDLSGTTASIALTEVVAPKPGEVALVTAAAGGTGQFAVQLLKHVYKCKVVGTCSSPDKVELLRKLGCDVAINYKQEDVGKVLRHHFPTGVNIVYESVGGAMLHTALEHIALKGRILTIGSISGYQNLSSWSTAGTPSDSVIPIPSQLLMKSASLRGFFLPHFQKYASAHFDKLVELERQGVIHSTIDSNRCFEGLESVADAVEYLHSGANIGKVVVRISAP